MSKKENQLKELFENKYGQLTDSEIQKELLFAQKLANKKIDKLNSSVSNLVILIIVLPIIVALLTYVLIN